MALKYEEREIDGLIVGTKQFPAVKGFKLFAKLGKMLSPVMAHLGALASGKDMKGLERLLARDVTQLGPALKEAFTQLEEADADKFICDVLSSTRVQVNGKWLDLSAMDRVNAAFEGRMDTMVKAALFALEVNYADFIGGVLLKNPSEEAREKDDSSNSTKTS